MELKARDFLPKDIFGQGILCQGILFLRGLWARDFLCKGTMGYQSRDFFQGICTL